MNHPFLPFCSRRLINLADMKSFGIAQLFVAEYICQSRYEQATVAALDSDQSSTIPHQDKKKFFDDLDVLDRYCNQWELKGTLRALRQFRNKLEINDLPLYDHEIAHWFNTVRQNLTEDVCLLGLAFVPTSKTEHFEQEKLFGEKVFNRFKQAQYDIKEAGNCLATGANTACVFHLMRVAEHALRALARRFDIELVNTTTRRSKPIEEATWQEIIDEVNLEIRNARNRATPAQEKRIEAYLHLNMACKAIKHLWRNPVSHLRGSYTEVKASKIYNSVRDVMQNACVVLSGRR